MKLKKLHEDDVIREDTEVGDVRATRIDVPETNPNIFSKNLIKSQVRVDCYDDKNSEYLSISFDYIEGIDMNKYIDMALPTFINNLKNGE